MSLALMAVCRCLYLSTELWEPLACDQHNVCRQLTSWTLYQTILSACPILCNGNNYHWDSDWARGHFCL